MGKKRPYKGPVVVKRCNKCQQNAAHRLRRTRNGAMRPESPCRSCAIAVHVARKQKDGPRTKLRNTYYNMLARCYNPRAQGYKDYGARGIRVCARWFKSFVLFAEDMGNAPAPELTIERKNPDGPYGCGKCPECAANGLTECNVRWATVTEQNRNRRGNHLLTLNGESYTIGEWAERLKIPPSTISSRLRRGATDAEALSVEVPAEVCARELDGLERCAETPDLMRDRWCVLCHMAEVDMGPADLAQVPAPF